MDTTTTKPTIRKQLQTITMQETENRLKNDFGVDASHPSELERESPALDYCHENAPLLGKSFTNAGIDGAYIQWGVSGMANTHPPKPYKKQRIPDEYISGPK